MASNRFRPLVDTSVHESPAPTSAPTSAPAPSAADSSATAKPVRPPRKRKGHRGGKKKRTRRKSFALLHGDSHDDTDRASSAGSFYNHPQGNLSGASIDSEILLDHRCVSPPTYCRRVCAMSTNSCTESILRCAFDVPRPLAIDYRIHSPAPTADCALSRRTTAVTNPVLGRHGTRIRRYSPILLGSVIPVPPATVARIAEPTGARAAGRRQYLPAQSWLPHLEERTSTM